MRRHLKPLATLAALLLLGSACGSAGPQGARAAELEPTDVVLAAFSQFDATAIDITITVDADVEALAAVFDSELTDPDDRAMAELLTQAELRLVGSGHDQALTVAFGGDPLFEVRAIDQVAYLRVDLDAARGLIERVEPGGSTDLDELLGMLPFLAAGEPRLGFLGKLIAGEWVSLELPTDSELSGLWGSGADPDQISEELAAVLDSILDETTEVIADGTARGGDRYLVRVEAVRMAAAFAENPLTARAFGLVGSDPDQLVDDLLADGVAPIWELDVVIIDGQLGSLRIDLASISTDAPAGATLPVLFTFAASPMAPSAPASHTPVPTGLLDQMLGEMTGEMLGGMLGGLSPAKTSAPLKS